MQLVREVLNYLYAVDLYAVDLYAADLYAVDLYAVDFYAVDLYVVNPYTYGLKYTLRYRCLCAACMRE